MDRLCLDLSHAVRKVSCDASPSSVSDIALCPSLVPSHAVLFCWTEGELWNTPDDEGTGMAPPSPPPSPPSVPASGSPSSGQGWWHFWDSSSSGSHSSSGASEGTTLGIIFGVVALVGFVAIVSIIVWRRRRSDSKVFV